ncbi:methyltransferase [Maribacter arenosus]|uniref:Methyltransferase domain-containing protein n=1 Tax=Maribacter arenosus TaxID=1854708 RepID=A0ABR7VCY3_9FLAO|nr:methyltransferase [Maribacter arenosus]MBD0851181.1 methyltransferase domain-containing protein [Maribacter arenosus]
MRNLNKEYWDDKYAQNTTGWDIGYVSTPLKEYIDQLKDKNSKILIPGAGNGHEVEYLFKKGFTNIYVIDIALQPLQNLKARIPSFPDNHLIHMDFFDLTISDFDLILEQTFFCALDPSLREAYAMKMHGLLGPNGKLSGLLFDFPLTEDGPPFGGSVAEYRSIFSQYFTIKVLEPAYNSIKPRKDNELFFIFEK